MVQWSQEKFIFFSMLQYAEKYNWWTPKRKKGQLSLEAKIESILERGTLEEWIKALHEVGGAQLFEVWNSRLKAKPLPKRKRVLEYFVETHKNDNNEH